MSAQPIPVAPARASHRPRLHVVAGTKASMAPFVVMLAVLLGLGMAGQLALTTVLQNQAFTVDAKQATAQTLANELSDLQTKATQASSTTSLAAKASALGMRPNPYPAQLRLPDGAVSGELTAVTGEEMPSDTYRTPAQQAAERKASDAAAVREQQAAAAKKKADEAAAKAQAAQKAGDTANAPAGNANPAGGPKKVNDQ